MRTIAIVVLLCVAGQHVAQDSKPPSRTAEEQRLHEKLLVLNKNAQGLVNAKKYVDAAKVFQEILGHLDGLKGDGAGDEIAFAKFNTLFNLAACLQAGGDADQALQFFQRGVTIGRALFPAEQKPKGHPLLAMMLNQSGSILRSKGRFAEALPCFADELRIQRQQFPSDKFPDGHPDLRGAVNNLAYVYSNIGRPDKAIPLYEESLLMARRLNPESGHPQGHEAVADATSALAFTLVEAGQPARAEPLFAECLAIRRRLYPAQTYPTGHENLAIAVQNMGYVHMVLGRTDQALRFYEEAVELNRRLYPAKSFPNGHLSLAGALKGYGVALKDLGEYERAMTLFEQALAMTRSVFPPDRFPKGHKDLVEILNDLGFALSMVGRPDQAESYYRQALEMIEKLPSDHPRHRRLATVVISNLSSLYLTTRKPKLALPLIVRSKEILRTLYPADRFPNGHPEFLIVLNNLGTAHMAIGNMNEGRAALDEALGIMRKLFPRERFPEGHPELPTMLINRSVHYRLAGEKQKSLELLAEAAEVQERRLAREADALSEAQLLSLRASLQPALHAFLDQSSGDATHDERAFQFVAVRQSQVLAVLRQRHQAVRVASLQSEAAREQWARLVVVRRESARLILEPASDLAARDRRLQALAHEQDSLERALAPAVSGFSKQHAPDDFLKLTTILPSGVAFVDFVRHGVSDYDDAKTMHDSAFVVVRGQPIRRLDLGPCSIIDQAIARWRRAIDTRNERDEPNIFRQLVWSRLAALLPPGTHTVYIYADTDLARVPWCAVPGTREGTILLEELSAAVVPSPAWLLGRLSAPVEPSIAPSRMLTVGNVHYGSAGPYSSLPDAAKEVDRAAAVFPGRDVVRLSGAQPTTLALRSELTTVDYAHLATHGFFDEAGLIADRKRGTQALAQWQFRGSDWAPRGLGAKHPLAYVGLALASANNGKADGVLTGLDVVDLPLERLRLVVLSACETGLGATTFGEGVAGLQRAFHAAGSSNVIASLWKVNDAATAALMTKFYHEMWVNKKPPIEALREAQLTIYRRADLIPALAAERGLKLEEALNAKSTPPAEAKGTTPTKLWAAFVLSGVGR